MLNTFDKF